MAADVTAFNYILYDEVTWFNIKSNQLPDLVIWYVCILYETFRTLVK